MSSYFFLVIFGGHMLHSFAGRLKLIFAALVLLMLISACEPKSWEDQRDPIWWNDAIFYEIFVRSFYDSDGDGIGDFNGLTSKLDYLNDGDPNTNSDLGITGIWLMPIHPSPSYHGYDVTDYLAINPEYGTMEDFKAFLSEAKQRGIRVIIDLVINHTSIDHPWFVASAGGDPDKRDWYIWSDEGLSYKGPWGQDVWYKSGDAYYYAVFWSGMPDLNYRNPAVTAEINKIAAFWLNDVGVDGFRIDGAKHLIEEGNNQENTDATHAWFKDFHQSNKALAPDSLTVGEIWDTAEKAARYVNNDEMDLVFNFSLAEDIIAGALFGDAARISNSIEQQERAYNPGRYATFLTNHDIGRTMTRLNGDVDKAKVAASILFTAPGVPFIYYGEEVGMTGDKPDALIRTPMQWSEDQNAGFTTGTSWMRINSDYQLRNVQVMSDDPNSLLKHYQQLASIRSNHYALRGGDYIRVETNQRRLFAMLRVAEKEAVLVLINLGKEALSDPRLNWEDSELRGSVKPVVLLGSEDFATLKLNNQGGVEEYQPMPEVPPYTTIILQFRR
jgi:alpha-amylase